MVVDWKNKIINIPQTDLTLIGGTLYELDTEWFKDEIRTLEASIYGMPNLRILDHNTSYTVAGVTYARKVEVINGYKVRFEDGQYSVRLAGSNNNLFDVEDGILFQNQVQVIPTNSAGLIVKTIGSGVTSQDKTDIAELSRQEIDINSTQLQAIKVKTDIIPSDPATETTLGIIEGKIDIIKNIELGRWVLDTVNNQMVLYSEDNITEIARFDLKDKDGNPSSTEVFERVRV